MKEKKPIIFLEGKKVILSPLERDDLFPVSRILNDYRIRKNLSERFPKNIEMLKELIKKGEEKKTLVLKIVDKQTGNLAGIISLTDFNWPNRRAMLSIVIDQNFQNKGYGTEATKMVVEYGFKNLQLHKICLEVYDFNKNAIALYKKLGFKKEGHYKKHSFKDGKYVDLIFMSRIND